jgi:type IV secretion system protein VirB10
MIFDSIAALHPNAISRGHGEERSGFLRCGLQKEAILGRELLVYRDMGYFMRLTQARWIAVIALSLLIADSEATLAQAPGEPGAAAQLSAAARVTQTPETSTAADATVAPTDSQSIEPAKKVYTVPAGTKVLLQLRSGINTKSAKPGDGVYLSSTFPVIAENRVMIPAGVYVQGVVDRVVRAGRVKGKSQLDMHFTSIIFPNGTVVEIPGLVNSLPGTSKQTVKDDGEGTIEQGGDKGRNAAKTAEIALPTGATVGSIGGLGAGHPIAGGVIGLGAGLAAVGLVSLFTRGADVNIESGTQVEMVLQRPLLLEEENLAGNTGPGTAPALVPLANQQRPLEKPSRPQILCPPGGLGCS